MSESGKPNDNDFAKQASGQEVGFLGELWGMLKQNKKWWLLPIIVALVVVAGLIILGGTAAAPFIYTLF